MASEAWQCPTLLLNGFGEHRIEGIGDKHVPWGHNVRDTDAVAAIDDEDCLRILRLFNEPAGREHLVARGVGEGEVEQLGWLGISSIANLLAAIKTAKYFELGEGTCCSPCSRIRPIFTRRAWRSCASSGGAYTEKDAVADYAGPLAHQGRDGFKELTYPERKAIHNLKYYMWVEQQGKTVQELNAQWDPEYWRARFEDEVAYFDQLITEFNRQAGAAD